MLNNKNLRVVVADDEETNLYILMRSMSEYGYDTTGFDSGLKAWNYLEKNAHQVDLVILDKMMYDLSGLEIIRRMKNHPVLKYTPVMLQSGDVDIEEGLNAGADRYLMKPFRSSDLINVVHELISVSFGNNAAYC